MRNDTEFNLDERNKVSCVLFNLHIAAYESGKILSLPVKVVASVSGELKLCVPRNYLFYDKHGGMSHSQFRKLYLDVLSKSLTYISMCIHNRKLVETANSVGKFSRQLDKLCSEMKQRNSDFWDEQNII